LTPEEEAWVVMKVRDEMGWDPIDPLKPCRVMMICHG
jgi:hypothetical protein